jgi:hypothetical protein
MQVSTRRSFVFMAIGALVGLVMAGYALFTARGTSTLIVPPEDVALVNQQPISRSDFLLQLQSLFSVDLQHATVTQRRKVLDDMIREELFVQRGKELDVASTDPEVRSAMVNSVELEIAADAITTQPTDQQLRSYYTSHQERYASEGIMSLRDWTFPLSDTRDAAGAAAALASAPPTPELMQRWHAAESKKKYDDEFYFAAKIHLGDQLFDIARDMTDNSVSAPIQTADAIHVLYMLDNRKPVPFDFAAARDRVLSDYRKDAIGHLRTGDETFLRKRANVLIADDVL